MDQQRKIIREMLRKMPLPAAREILQTNLPRRECDAVYYCDCEDETLLYIGEHRLACGESAVKKYRKSGYDRLAALYFSKKE